jgi:hypothetical protein
VARGMTWNSVERQTFSNISATTAAFTLRGGQYGVDVNATFGPGSVTLQKLAADGSTWVTALTAFTAAGYATVNLPSGTYRLSVVTTTAIYAVITSVVTTM